MTEAQLLSKYGFCQSHDDNPSVRLKNLVYNSNEGNLENSVLIINWCIRDLCTNIRDGQVWN
jgi:hypothetical protein